MIEEDVVVKVEPKVLDGIKDPKTGKIGPPRQGYNANFAAQKRVRVKKVTTTTDADTGKELEPVKEVISKLQTLCAYGENLELTGPIPMKGDNPDWAKVKTALRNHPDYDGLIARSRANVAAWKPETQSGPKQYAPEEGDGILS